METQLLMIAILLAAAALVVSIIALYQKKTKVVEYREDVKHQTALKIRHLEETQQAILNSIKLHNSIFENYELKPKKK